MNKRETIQKRLASQSKTLIELNEVGAALVDCYGLTAETAKKYTTQFTEEYIKEEYPRIVDYLS